MKRRQKTESRLRRLSASVRGRLDEQPTLRLSLRAAGAFAAGLLLASASAFDSPLPLALALMGALPFGLPAVCVGLGAAVGYWTLWSAAQAIEPLAAGLLILAGSCLLGNELPRTGWARPLFFSVLYLAVGLVLLLDCVSWAYSGTLLALRLGLLAVLTERFSRMDGTDRRLLALGLLAGLGRVRLFSAVSLSLPLGAAAVLLVCERGEAPLWSALCGLCLDLSLRPALPMTGVFLLADLCCRGLRLPLRVLRAIEFWAFCVGASLLLRRTAGAELLGLGLGAGLFCVLPKELLREKTPDEPKRDIQTERLRTGVSLLENVCSLLDRPAVRELETSSAAIFDRAAEQVCRNCGKWEICWQRRAENTYLALSHAAGGILRKGSAGRDDLPPYFLEQCCHVDGFLTAVNEELGEQLSLRRCRVRMDETRTIVSDQFRFLSRLLTALCEPPEAEEKAAFHPELGVSVAGRADISGDSTASFRVGARYYLMLCDGMGTGAEAARESGQAQTLVQSLAQLGFDAADALQMLNELYILRGDGAFSTVDLLQLDLVSGEGCLYKWGAAPSYLVLGDGTVRTLGSVTAPPGLGVGQTQQAQCIPVSLREGELLALLSDGVEAEQAQVFLTNAPHLSPRQTANGLVFRGSREDDRSAAALRLHPVPTRAEKSRRRAKTLSRA